MKIIYAGANDGVQVHLGGGVYVGAARGDTVDVPADVAHALCATGEWQSKKSTPGPSEENE